MPVTTDTYTGVPVWVSKTNNSNNYSQGEDLATWTAGDYTLSITSNGVQVAFNTTPVAYTTILVGLTSDIVHPTGSEVFDGRVKYDIRPDRNIGGMVYY